MKTKRAYTPRRVDANHADIVAALRAIGATVLDIHDIGNGAPDLVVGFRAVNLLLEVKDGRKSVSARKLTPDEQKFFEEWRGPIHIVYGVADAIEVVDRMTSNDDEDIPF